MAIIHIVRGDTPDALWREENDLKKTATIRLGLPATAIWSNPSRNQFLQLGSDDTLVAKTLASLLGVDERIAQFPGEVLKAQWTFLFSSPNPPRIVLTEDKEGQGHPIDTHANRAKWLTWATRFTPTPIEEIPSQDAQGQLPHGLKRVFREGAVPVVVPDDAQEEIHDLIVKLYVDERLSLSNVVETLDERNIRGPRGGKYNHKAVRKILVDRNVRIRKSRVGQKEGKRNHYATTGDKPT